MHKRKPPGLANTRTSYLASLASHTEQLVSTVYRGIMGLGVIRLQIKWLIQSIWIAVTTILPWKESW